MTFSYQYIVDSILNVLVEAHILNLHIPGRVWGKDSTPSHTQQVGGVQGEGGDSGTAPRTPVVSRLATCQVQLTGDDG